MSFFPFFALFHDKHSSTLHLVSSLFFCLLGKNENGDPYLSTIRVCVYLCALAKRFFSFSIILKSSPFSWFWFIHNSGFIHIDSFPSKVVPKKLSSKCHVWSWENYPHTHLYTHSHTFVTFFFIYQHIFRVIWLIPSLKHSLSTIVALLSVNFLWTNHLNYP